MENCTIYFDELIERIKNGDYRKILVLKGEREGYQVKFGYGVSLTVNTTIKRAYINLFDNGQVDIEDIAETITQARLNKARKRLESAEEMYDRTVNGIAHYYDKPAPKKSFWQRLFKK